MLILNLEMQESFLREWFLFYLPVRVVPVKRVEFFNQPGCFLEFIPHRFCSHCGKKLALF